MNSVREFWTAFALVALSVVVRLYRLGVPAATEGSWRETDGLAMARNLHQGVGTFLEPVVDWTGRNAVATELPLLPWLASMLYGVTGVSEAAARVLIVTCSALLVLASWRLSRQWFGAWGALTVALIVALHPLTLYYGRTFLPDVPSLALAVSALWAFSGALRNERRAGWLFATAAALIGVAVAIKPSALILGPVFAAVAVRSGGWSALRRPAVLAVAGTALAAVVWLGWREYTIYNATGNTFGIFMGHDKFQSELLLQSAWWSEMGPRLASQTLPLALAPAAFAGLCYALYQRGRQAPILMWIACAVVWLFAVAEGNLDMPHYQLPAVVPIAMLCGGSVHWVAAHLSGRNRVIYAVGIAVSLTLGLTSGLRYAARSLQPHQEFLRDARVVDEALPDGAWVVLLGGNTHHIDGDDYDPRPFYHTHTRGWVLGDAGYDLTALSAYCAKGARYVLQRTPDPHFAKTDSHSHQVAPAQFQLWLRESRPLAQTEHLVAYAINCEALPAPKRHWRRKPGTDARPTVGGFELVARP